MSIAISALCSGLEVALVGSSKLYLELERKRGAIWARVLGDMLQRPSRVVGTLLVGNAVAFVLYGVVFTSVMGQMLPILNQGAAFELVVRVVIGTVVVLILGEFLPKLLFRMDPDRALSLFAIPLRVIYTVFWLPMMVVTSMGEGILRVFGVRGTSGQEAFGRVDLDEFLNDISNVPKGDESLDAEVEYFRNTLELSKIKVRDLMVPRAEIEAIQVDESVQTLQSRFAENGMSKMLVYKESIDKILGYVHGYELFRRPKSIQAIVRPVNFIPGTMPADEALQLFIKQRSHVAVVVDEYGGTAGIITMEDVVETIVGDIDDEHDTGNEEVEERLGPNEFLLSARAEVEHLVEKYRLAIPQRDDYETLAGFILHSTGDLPEQGQVIDLPPFRMTIAQVVHSRIDLVRLEVLDPETGFISD
ncbi:MAG: HlyC/CorC family transporter [Flavobacteriales bacterium]|nr:HlyC/CorC family transporter [Flavobacteriales bacterium]MBK6944797.1 HlyC/CorC family transporter [Flavobacteriales bacterium]MBK7295800.1 HlyC/CorC family transporter [Flavobacteriales bacterium]MBK9534454.1 HlyC/CorC family transporter [Flavobacteriales bacterium]MBP9139219.1 HlyC/CorC family transporter [Flavobacteriales bacterium]